MMMVIVIRRLRGSVVRCQHQLVSIKMSLGQQLHCEVLEYEIFSIVGRGRILLPEQVSPRQNPMIHYEQKMRVLLSQI